MRLPVNRFAWKRKLVLMSALTRVLVPSLHFYRRRETYSCTSAPMQFLESLLQRTKKKNNSIDTSLHQSLEFARLVSPFPCELLRVQSDVSPPANTTELKAANETRNCRFQHSKIWKLITSRVWKLGNLRARRVEGGKIWEFEGSRIFRSAIRNIGISRIFFFSPES